MTERGTERESYWTDDRLLSEVPLPDGAALVRLRLHQSEEPIPRRNTLVPLARPVGSRIYVHGQPYVLEPDITLTAALRLAAPVDRVIGAVTASTWDGMRHVAIGQAQAWFYPGDRLLMLWECYLLESYRQDDPTHDPALAALWQGFEAELARRFPAAERLATLAWEDLYDRSAWQDFLARLGYAPETAIVFSKRIGGRPD